MKFSLKRVKDTTQSHLAVPMHDIRKTKSNTAPSWVYGWTPCPHPHAARCFCNEATHTCRLHKASSSPTWSLGRNPHSPAAHMPSNSCREQCSLAFMNAADSKHSNVPRLQISSAIMQTRPHPKDARLVTSPMDQTVGCSLASGESVGETQHFTAVHTGALVPWPAQCSMGLVQQRQPVQLSLHNYHRRKPMQPGLPMALSFPSAECA